MRAFTLAALAAVALATGAVATDAAADDKALAASGAGGAPLSRLAVGTLAAPPRGKPPASIPGGEKVPGVFVALPASFNKRPQGYVMVLGNASEAKDIAKGSFRGESPTSGSTCFTEQQSGRFGSDDPDDPATTSWSSDLRAQVTLVNAVERGERPAVTAVHGERIVTSGSAVSLESVDAWVDPLTRGARLITKSSLPLTPVGVYADEQQRVYAARDGELVHVVLVRSMDHHDERRSSDALFATANENIFTSACDHIRTTLRARKGQASTASIVSTVQLAHLEKKPDAPAPNDAPETRKQMITQLNDMRSRPMHVSPSVSWPSREREALLTVSAGWDARERNGFGGF